MILVHQENFENLAIQSYKGPGPEGCIIFLKNLKTNQVLYLQGDIMCYSEDGH